MVKKKNLNEPEIPPLTKAEELAIENQELAKALSRIKYHLPHATEFLTEQQLTIIKKYAP